jgi:hypothetical protein
VDRFERQRVISGWDQRRVSAGVVAVVGRDWLGAFTIWALGCLGVGDILWVGAPIPPTDAFTRWILADPCPFLDCRIFDYPFDVESSSELKWALSGPKPDAIVCCAETKATHAECLAWARTNGVKFLAATTAGDGWIGSAVPSILESGGRQPISAMLLAALLTDFVREFLLPMWGGARERLAVCA